MPTSGNRGNFFNLVLELMTNFSIKYSGEIDIMNTVCLHGCFLIVKAEDQLLHTKLQLSS